MTADDRADWQYAVANGDTSLGFKDWLAHRAESDAPSNGLIDPSKLGRITAQRINDPQVGDVEELGVWERRGGKWVRTS